MSEMQPVTEEMLAESNKPSAYISARHRQDAVLKPTKPGGNYMFAGICSIIALIIYAALVFMLYNDFSILANA